MSTAKERQAKRRAKIRADSELHQAQLLRDRERKKCQRNAQKEMSEHQLEEHRLKERLLIKANQGLSIEAVHETNEFHSKHHKPGNTILLTANPRKSHETT